MDDSQRNKSVRWEVRGCGAGAIVIAKCSQCRGTFEIMRPTLNTHIQHCGELFKPGRTRLPEKIYELWTEARDGVRRSQ